MVAADAGIGQQRCQSQADEGTQAKDCGPEEMQSREVFDAAEIQYEREMPKGGDRE